MGQYRNVKPSEKFGGNFWQGEVLSKSVDGGDHWRFHDGIWAQSEEAALADFAKQAERYADYVTDPVREAASYDALMKDIAVWGCE